MRATTTTVWVTRRHWSGGHNKVSGLQKCFDNIVRQSVIVSVLLYWPEALSPYQRTQCLSRSLSACDPWRWYTISGQRIHGFRGFTKTTLLRYIVCHPTVSYRWFCLECFFIVNA